MMEVIRPADVQEAAAALADDPAAVLLAGGTDLMVEVNFGRIRPSAVITLRRVEELQELSHHRIGAGVTFRTLETGGHKALAQLSRTIGSPQIREAGTIGGNIGTASPAGDSLPFLAGLDARIELFSAAGGVRRGPWGEFFTGVKQTSKRPDELITAALLPEDLPDRQEFAKIGQRSAMVISIVCVCVFRWSSGRTRVALGSVGPGPLRARRAEEMISNEPNPGEAALAEFARLVSEEVRPITDHRGAADYRRRSSGVLARRLLERCLAS